MRRGKDRREEREGKERGGEERKGGKERQSSREEKRRAGGAYGINFGAVPITYVLRLLQGRLCTTTTTTYDNENSNNNDKKNNNNSHEDVSPTATIPENIGKKNKRPPVDCSYRSYYNKKTVTRESTINDQNHSPVKSFKRSEIVHIRGIT